MSLSVVLHCERRTVERKGFISGHYLRRQSAGRRWRKREVPIFNARRSAEMFSCVLVRGNFSADRMQPFVPVGVIKMPVRVDQVFDRIAAEVRQCFSYPSPCAWNAGVDEKLPIAASED